MKPRSRSIVNFLAASCISFITIAGLSCSSGTAPSSGSGNNNVQMSGFSFSVSAITVKQGEAVTWTNNDNVHHTCTSDNGTWDSGDLAPGHSFSYTFNASGTYHYSCTYHKSMGMVAVVIVTPTQQ